MRRILPLIAIVFLVVAASPAIAAEPALDGEWKLPTVTDDPGRLKLGPDGNVWVVIGNKIGRLNADQSITEFPLPKTPVDLTVGPSATGGANDRLWLSYNGGVIEFDPANPAAPVDHVVTEITTAQDIELGPDNMLYVVDSDAASGGIVEVNPDNGQFSDEVIEANADGRGITAGSDGRMWWVGFNSTLVYATKTDESMATTSWDLDGNYHDIAAGPAGQLAFGDAAGQKLGRITTEGATEFRPSGVDPTGVVFGNDGAYWFAQTFSDNLARMTPEGEVTTPISWPADSRPRRIAKGPGDTLFVSLEDGADTNPRIARVTGVDAPDPPVQNPPPPPPPPPPPGDITAPFFSSVGLTRSVFAVGTRRTAVAAQRRRVRRGTTLRFTLSEAATVRIAVQRRRTGRRRAGTCVKPTARLRRRGARKCARWVKALPTLRRAGTAGLSKVRFTGRVRRRTLRPGRYRFRMTATDAAANRSPARTKRFRIVRAARRG